MIISIHQPYYIPWLGFFHKILSTDALVLLDHVQYADKDNQNRNYIKTSQGPLLLTVPVLLPSYDTGALDVKINNNVPWQKKHWRSIEMNYGKAKFFKQYRYFFEDIYQKEWINLIDLNIEIIEFMAKAFELNAKFYRSSELDIKLSKNEQLVEICQKVSADGFVSGACAAESYLDYEIFTQNDIKLYIHDFHHPEYPQLHGNFQPRLSALDLLFNCGPAGRKFLEESGSYVEPSVK